MKPEDVKIEDIWAEEQSILDVIDKVCRENNLKYSIAYGTLIGAIRHGGFIPWDDDIDVMMPREDYDKLKEIWADTAPEGFLLQNEDDYDDYVNNFAKIRKDHTTFLQFENEKARTYHKGFYVDIFPGDRKAPGKIRNIIQQLLFAINLLFNRGYLSGTGGIIGFIERILLKIVRKKNYRKISKWAGRRSRRWNKQKKNMYVFPATIRACRIFYPADMFDETVPIMFNGKKYAAVKSIDTVLRVEYGDYMQLPPEENRVWKHHPILIDFEHNYEELVKEGKV